MIKRLLLIAALAAVVAVFSGSTNTPVTTPEATAQTSGFCKVTAMMYQTTGINRIKARLKFSCSGPQYGFSAFYCFQRKFRGTREWKDQKCAHFYKTRYSSVYSTTVYDLCSYTTIDDYLWRLEYLGGSLYNNKWIWGTVAYTPKYEYALYFGSSGFPIGYCY